MSIGYKTSKRGFTLIELIVAIGVLAIFASFMVAALNPLEQFRKSSDARRKNDLAQIQRALEAYYQDYGSYPEASSGQIVNESVALNWGSSWSPYMDILPEDPDSARNYAYNTSSNGQSYWIFAALERGSIDEQACNAGGVCTNATGLSCGSGVVCNYGVSSPNVSP